MKVAATRRHISAVAALVFVLVVASGAMATQPVFTSPQGFSIAPPDGWTVASNETNNQLTSAVREHFPKLGSMDFDKLAVMILNPADSGESNLNVVVSPGKIPIEEPGAEDKLAHMLRDHYSQMGLKLDRISATRRVFGTHTALLVDLEWDRAQVGAQSILRQWQVALPAGGQTLIVTCSAPKSSFEGVTPVFTRAIESMTYSNSPDSAMPAWLRDALGGGVIGGLLALFSSFTSRKNA